MISVYIGFNIVVHFFQTLCLDIAPILDVQQYYYQDVTDDHKKIGSVATFASKTRSSGIRSWRQGCRQEKPREVLLGRNSAAVI